MSSQRTKQEQKSTDEVELEPMHPVGLREYEAAKSHLRRNSGFDFDSFLEEVRAGKLFEEPLGPSAKCLSVNQIADYVAAVKGKRSTAEVRAVETHLGSCNTCSENVRVYRTLSERHPVEEPVSALAGST
jgi:hypothetical protein